MSETNNNNNSVESVLRSMSTHNAEECTTTQEECKKSPENCCKNENNANTAFQEAATTDAEANSEKDCQGQDPAESIVREITDVSQCGDADPSSCCPHLLKE